MMPAMLMPRASATVVTAAELALPADTVVVLTMLAFCYNDTTAIILFHTIQHLLTNTLETKHTKAAATTYVKSTFY